MSTETERRETAAGAARGERKLTFVIDDDALFNGDQGDRQGDSSGSFLELATALAQRQWFILKMTAAAAIIGIAVALLLPNWYTAETKILPPQQQQSSAVAVLSSLGGAAGNLASVAGKDLGLRNPNDLYVGMLKTRPIADALIKRFDLQKVYRSKDMTDARKTLADHTDIGKDRHDQHFGGREGQTARGGHGQFICGGAAQVDQGAGAYRSIAATLVL
jgi:Chain length determinant protein